MGRALGSGLRILAIADLHGCIEPLQRLEGQAFDLVVVCGDLHGRGSRGEARSLAETLATFGPDVLVVPGNMDPHEFVSMWDGAGLKVVHRRSWVKGDVGFLGMGGTVARSPKMLRSSTRFYHRDEEVYSVLSKLCGEISKAKIKVVLAHQPPFGLLDVTWNGEHTGCLSLRRFLEERQPDLLLCGHIHEARGEAVLGKTKVVNLGEFCKGYGVVVSTGGRVEVDLKSF